MRFLLFTIMVKTATTTATATCSKGPIPTHLGKTTMLWLFLKVPSKADIAIIIECNNFDMKTSY